MPLTPLVLFEHETIPFNWTDRDLRLLAAINGRAGDSILTPKIDAKGKQLQAAQYVGVVRLGEQTIQILPKIHKSRVSNAARECTKDRRPMGTRDSRPVGTSSESPTSLMNT
ncbi:MAG: hypothetical protein U0X20_24805 [Caldilineaceae bacterium]